MSKETLERLKDELRTFAAERDWDQFHSPKNLAMALNVEAAELLEHFHRRFAHGTNLQWRLPRCSTMTRSPTIVAWRSSTASHRPLSGLTSFYLAQMHNRPSSSSSLSSNKERARRRPTKMESSARDSRGAQRT